MLLNLILLQLSAHLLADFILQPQNLSDKKGVKIFSRYHLYHAIIVGALSYLCSFDAGFWKAALVIAFLHLLTDILKSWLSIKNVKKNYFFTDQFMHIAALIAVTILYSKIFGIHFIIPVETQIVAIVTGFLLCAKPANIIIKNIFDVFSIQIPGENDDEPAEDDSLPNAGKLIGITERFLGLALIIIGQYGAVGLIIAAKSILRFSNPKKSEYVLVGTLLSFGIAIFTGLLINIII